MSTKVPSVSSRHSHSSSLRICTGSRTPTSSWPSCGPAWRPMEHYRLLIDAWTTHLCSCVFLHCCPHSSKQPTLPATRAYIRCFATYTPTFMFPPLATLSRILSERVPRANETKLSTCTPPDCCNHWRYRPRCGLTSPWTLWRDYPRCTASRSS